MEAEPMELLLVEDDPNDVELTLCVLGRHNLANTLHVVRDGAEALEFLFGTGRYADRPVERAPGLILLDLKLPKIDGLQVLRRLKGDERTRDIPVIVLISSPPERELVERCALGVNGYVVRPLEFVHLVEAAVALGFRWLLFKEPYAVQPI